MSDVQMRPCVPREEARFAAVRLASNDVSTLERACWAAQDSTCVANHEVDWGSGVGDHSGGGCVLGVHCACVDNALGWLAHIVYHGAGPLVDLHPQAKPRQAGVVCCVVDASGWVASCKAATQHDMRLSSEMRVAATMNKCAWPARRVHSSAVAALRQSRERGWN